VNLKVAVYTIALNEEHFVERWYESAKDADYLLIADTGSIDDTVAKAKALGINVVSIHVKPWRFDTARNASMALIPDDIDYCIALDMDEVLVPGWRQELEKVDKDRITRPRYQYTWSWNEDGSPGLQYGGDKIHSRFGYRWKHPVHEVMSRYGDTPETQTWTSLEIHHYPDNSKPRSQYLPLLKLAVLEDPYDDRNAFYYARELYFYGLFDEALIEFKRHLSLPRATWPPERAASMRYIAKISKDEAELWLTLAANEAPGRREPHVDLANHHYRMSEWEKCYKQATTALSIVEKPLEYLCEPEAWGHTPHDLAAIAAYNLRLYNEAYDHALKAFELAPASEKDRLAANLEFCERAMDQ
jgi:glycosyltransferase involved in cell wall biosynthesis